MGKYTPGAYNIDSKDWLALLKRQWIDHSQPGYVDICIKYWMLDEWELDNFGLEELEEELEESIQFYQTLAVILKPHCSRFRKLKADCSYDFVEKLSVSETVPL